MKNETFTPERIKAEADAFFEWDGEDRSLVTTTSCLLFAQHIAGLMQARSAQPAPVVPEGYVLVPVEPTEQIRDALYTSGFEAADTILNYAYRAMLTAAPAQGQQVEFGDAYQGAREDLAIWKRRALEAEEKLRQQGSIIDHLTLEAQGETRMGEPRIAQGQQSPNYWRVLAVANRKVADEALAELSALKAQQVGQEPVARKTWRAGNPSYLCHHCGTPLMQHEQQVFCPTGPAFASGSTAPQPAPAQDVAGLVEAASGALAEIQAVMQEAYNSATPVCCGRGISECCGSPDPEWSEHDQRTMDRFAPHELALRAALADLDKQSGEVKP